MNKRKKKITEEQEWGYKHDFPLSDVWEIDHILAKLIVPRLRAFKDADKFSSPDGLDMRGWNQTARKMIDAFALMQDNIVLTDKDEKNSGRTWLVLQVLPQPMGLKIL